MEQTELMARLVSAMRAAKTGKTDEELEAFAKLALAALESYEDSLAGEDDYDEDDAFESVFLAVAGENDEKDEDAALLLPLLMDELSDLAEED